MKKTRNKLTMRIQYVYDGSHDTEHTYNQVESGTRPDPS